MNKIIFVGFLLIVLLLLALRFLSGDEDNWVCVDNQWVKHGQPRAPQPTGICKPTGIR